jgi:Tfp pilus assembly protein PilV
MSKEVRLGNNGFTIVETAVALAIFALCIGGMCALIVTGKQLRDQARWHYTAVNLAKNRLERARALPFESLDVLKESNIRVNRSGFPDAGGNYRRTTYVNEVKTDLLKELVVIVEIKDRRSLEFEGEQEELRSYFADYVTPDE